MGKKPPNLIIRKAKEFSQLSITICEYNVYMINENTPKGFAQIFYSYHSPLEAPLSLLFL